MVRPATVADVDQMVELRAELFADMAGSGSASRPDEALGKGWKPAARQVIAEQLADPSHHYVVAVTLQPDCPGQVIGWGRASLVRHLPGPGFPTGWSGLVNSLVTAREARGCGAGTAVASSLVEWLVSSGVEVIDLLASTDSAALFRRLGFAEPPSTALRWKKLSSRPSTT